VQRVAGIYFRPENRTVVHMLPMAMKPGQAEEKTEEKKEGKP
jgi:hypothetical protein